MEIEIFTLKKKNRYISVSWFKQLYWWRHTGFWGSGLLFIFLIIIYKLKQKEKVSFWTIYHSNWLGMISDQFMKINIEISVVWIWIIQHRCDFFFWLCCRGPGLGFRTSAEVEITADVFLYVWVNKSKKKGEVKRERLGWMMYSRADKVPIFTHGTAEIMESLAELPWHPLDGEKSVKRQGKSSGNSKI